MPLGKKANIYLKRKAIIANVSFAFAIIALFISSCSDKKKTFGEAVQDRDSIAVMTTTGIESLISDSGIIRYKIIAEEWQVFDRKNPPYWSFEKGIYLEQFDTLFNIEAQIKADTAYHYTSKKLWKLIGNVMIKNREGKNFYTELLFWNQYEKRVYTDKFLTIEEPTRITHAYGLEANESLTECVFKKVNAIIDVQENMLQPTDIISDVTPNDQ